MPSGCFARRFFVLTFLRLGNRPLRGFATHGEMRLRRSRQVGRGRRPSREAVARARANTPSEARAEPQGKQNTHKTQHKRRKRQ